MEINEKQFIAGYNTGYILAEYEPQVLTIILDKVSPVNSYISGLSFGRKEFELEQEKSKLNELQQLRQSGIDEKFRE